MSYKKTWDSSLARFLSDHFVTASPRAVAKYLTQGKLEAFKSLNGGELKPPIKLEIFASFCGVSDIVPKEDMKEFGQLTPINGKYEIWFRKDQSKLRKRFTIAHEIGHKLLFDFIATHPELNLSNSKDDEEYLCDLIALIILLLVPSHIEPILSKWKLGWVTVHQIHVDFQVSYEAAIRAVTENASKPIAFIFCVNENSHLVIKKDYCSETFPIKRYTNKQIPANSCIKRCFQNSRTEKGTEIFEFHDNARLQAEVVALHRSFYVYNDLFTGVIALLQNPISVVTP